MNIKGGAALSSGILSSMKNRYSSLMVEVKRLDSDVISSPEELTPMSHPSKAKLFQRHFLFRDGRPFIVSCS